MENEKYVSEIVHNLIVPFKYHCKGQEIEAKSIIVKAPSNEQLNDVSALDQFQNKGMIGMTKFAPDREELDQNKKGGKPPKQWNELTEEEKISSVLMSVNAGNDSMSKCYAHFKNILETSALVDGKEKMTGFLFNKMSPIDTRNLLGKYLVSFLPISLAG